MTAPDAAGVEALREAWVHAACRMLAGDALWAELNDKQRAEWQPLAERFVAKGMFAVDPLILVQSLPEPQESLTAILSKASRP